MRLFIVVTFFSFCIPLYAFMQQSTTQPDQFAIEKTLDTLHRAASKTDFDRYFECFAPDAIFLGTDATERWTMEQFKEFCKPLFDQNTGWTYVPRAGGRHVSLDPSSSFAWFDELLDNARYGECRGTGVLRQVGGEWKIVQYSLTFPVPNEIALDVVTKIKEHGKNKAK